MKKTLYLMRHGQTLFNVRRKVQGWCDSPLTELGKKQAKYASDYFKDITFDAAFSSTSERASDTLELVTDMNYTRLKGLKEWNFGTFEGESEDLNPQLPYGDFFVQYGGEGELEMRQRLVQTLLEIMQQPNKNTVLVVSHGAACAQFARHWEEKSQAGIARGLKNCCILKFEFENDEFTLVEIKNHDFSDLE
jgi:Fructose-2,6-bisphosphatase